ncbi:MAG: RluA family pseudouridine synthase [Chitinophagales bacterium]|nr:RluA family pseudouridine synthase [Chitinophagales bacterium]HAE13841.1 RNA pseudouridine synthase [Bacteroidota bacterium]MCB9020688.1 RluA family pseudouridine synthase [Chitinophagales bacterium]HPE96721.1 RluA family pseudouridine synthase [Chitinophagales bacterium]HQU39313.1 RluA family pseudouridine synthase [Chitinophagales bacterium]
MAEQDEKQQQEPLEEDLTEYFRVVIDRGQEPLRIDKFLVNRLENTSRTKVQSAADAGCIRVNGQIVKSNYKVRPGDDVQLILPVREDNYSLEPEDIPLDIVFEDEHLLVVNKPAGMVVHPGVGNFSGTLINALMFHLGKDNLPGDDDFRPGLVHRIDKNTSGLLVVAKSETAMQHLARQFFEHTVYRRYQALVWGELEEETGTITGNIARHARFRKLFDVYDDPAIGKHAVTHYRLLENLGYVALVECRLETGRTHQIRVHMQHIGHPIFNDDTYGGDRIVQGTIFTRYRQFIDNCFQIIPRHALHAISLGFVHPVSGEDLLFHAPLPDDFAGVLEKWRTYAAQLK